MTLRCAALAAAALLAEGLGAQGVRGPRALLRADAIAAPNSSVQLGVGASVLASAYVRPEFTAALGAAAADDATRWAGRVDAIVRFAIDPFAESTRAVHAVGGLSMMHDGQDWRPRVVVGLGVEGPVRGRVRWSTEVAVGGGVRLGMVARRARPNRR